MHSENKSGNCDSKTRYKSQNFLLGNLNVNVAMLSDNFSSAFPFWGNVSKTYAAISRGSENTTEALFATSAKATLNELSHHVAKLQDQNLQPELERDYLSTLKEDLEREKDHLVMALDDSELQIDLLQDKIWTCNRGDGNLGMAQT